MSFNGTEGGSVTLGNAGEWTSAWRDNFPEDKKGQFFGKDILEDILGQEGCMGIRMYFAIKSGEKILVLAGANSREDDQIDITQHTIADISVACPPSCGSNNDLNS